MRDNLTAALQIACAAHDAIEKSDEAWDYKLARQLGNLQALCGTLALDDERFTDEQRAIFRQLSVSNETEKAMQPPTQPGYVHLYFNDGSLEEG